MKFQQCFITSKCVTQSCNYSSWGKRSFALVMEEIQFIAERMVGRTMEKIEVTENGEPMFVLLHEVLSFEYFTRLFFLCPANRTFLPSRGFL